MKTLFATFFLLALGVSCSSDSKRVDRQEQVDEAQREFENEKLEAKQDYEKQLQEAKEEREEELEEVKYDEMNEEDKKD